VSAAAGDAVATLLPLLVCPACRGELAGRGGALECRGCGRSFDAADGVPRLLTAVPPVEAPSRNPFVRLFHAVVANPRVYDFTQAHGGYKHVERRLAPELGSLGGKTVLDVGAGTGTLARLLPANARYLWLDADAQKLQGFRRDSGERLALLADASRLPLHDGSVDVVLTVDVSHHLEDDVLVAFLDEAARVARERLVFLDAVASPRVRSRLLWRYDRGANPRPPQELIARLEASFVPLRVDRFRIHHDYVFFVGEPRR
jgi:SAM-dependent methyltransferase